MRLRSLLALFLGALAACSSNPPPPGGQQPGPPSLADFLPELPASAGPATAEAGLVTLENRDAKLPKGAAAKGLVGDYYLQNNKIRMLVQAPVRTGEVLGSGGNPVNLDFVRAPTDTGGTQFGELGPFFNLSHTANFTRVDVVRDGRSGGPAVLRATGVATVLDYFNIAGFVSGLGVLRWDSSNPPPLDVAATYFLYPGDPFVRVVHTLFNRSTEALPVAIGSFTDTGGDIEVFTPGTGFGEGSYSNLPAIFGSAKPFEYWAAQAADGAYGVVPAPAGPTVTKPNLGLFVAGVAGVLYDAPGTLIEASTTTNFSIPAQKGINVETYLVMGTDIADVHAKVLQLRGRAAGSVTGTLTASGDLTATPIAGARVAALGADGKPVTVAVTGADGSFRFRLEPGSYSLQADKVGWARAAATPIVVAAGAELHPELSLPLAATLPYVVRDGGGRPLAAKITLVGDTSLAPPDGRFRDASRIAPGRSIVRVAYTWRGSSALDGPVEVPAGEYRIFVSHGNEFSAYDERVTLTPGLNPALSITLQRVLDTTGYVSGDFHQHGVNSPDAPVPMQERVITYLAAGLEFIGSSDHDYLTDYGPTIRQMGMQDEIASMVGVETTPFDYGHFNAFPQTVNPEMPNQGAVDWGGGLGSNLSPGQIFAALRENGAQVVQVNHPRVTDPGSISGFQAYFDRAALTFDLGAGTFYGDKTKQPVANEVLRLASDEPMWSDDFDTLEVYNGFSIRDYNNDGEVDDQKVDLNLRDWFNFLSIGKILTALGNTDSHSRYTDTVDAPRNYLRVPDDTHPGAVRPEDILHALKSTHDAIVTNGPFVTLHVDGDTDPSMGKLYAAPSGTVRLTVKVQAPIWMQIDQVKIFCNNRYRIPPPTRGQHDPMDPRLVIRLKTEDEALEPGDVPLLRVTLAPGAERWETTVEIEEFALPDPGKDAWIVALVRGTKGMYPYIPNAVSGSATTADLMAGNVPGGVFALAFTNPTFVDVDGNGRYDAPLAK